MIEGEYQDVLKTFSDGLNFHIKQFKRLDGHWGKFDIKSDQWIGMISNLVNEEADLITASMSLCCGRSKAVDYLWTLSKERYGFVIKSKILDCTV